MRTPRNFGRRSCLRQMKSTSVSCQLMSAGVSCDHVIQMIFRTLSSGFLMWVGFLVLIPMNARADARARATLKSFDSSTATLEFTNGSRRARCSVNKATLEKLGYTMNEGTLVLLDLKGTMARPECLALGRDELGRTIAWEKQKEIR